MEGAVDAPFQDGKEALNGVGGDISPDVFPVGVVHGVVAALKALTQALVVAGIIGNQPGLLVDVLSDRLFEVPGVYGGHGHGPDLAVPLEHGDHGGLTLWTVAVVVIALIPRLAPDVGFIHLYSAV